MINKINEIIEKINSGDIGLTEDQVREIITTELSDYYTKEEVDDAIDDIDLTPYATKTYVDDAIDSIDLTPYATNERVTNEVETLDNKIDEEVQNLDSEKIDIHKENNLTDSNDTIYTLKKAIKLFNPTSDYGVGRGFLFNGKYGSTDNPSYGLIKFCASSGNKGAFVIETGSRLSNNSLEVLPTGGSSASAITISDSISYDGGYPIGLTISQGGTAFVIGKSSNNLCLFYYGSPNTKLIISENRIFIGTTPNNGKNSITDGLKYNAATKKLYYVKSSVENEITSMANMPTGKTVTDTVTFQDLIDMGFVNSPS